MNSLEAIFEAMNGLHVVVLGDVMLDNYWWGDVERISPEAPVPVVALKARESRLGGAANVALNCRALGAEVTLATVIGEDAEGLALRQLLHEAGISDELALGSPRRLTTTKTRVISRQQQMLRLDAEDVSEIGVADEHPFIDLVLRFLQRVKPDVLIFEDYNKGVLKDNIIRRVAAHCREIGIITTVDPKLNNFLSYEGVTIFKPNLKELREGLHLSLQTINEDTLSDADQKLRGYLNHEVSFFTLSEKGVYYNAGDAAAVIPAHLRNIADVSGAGDTVIATASLVYAITKDARLMAEVANIAGGLVCEQVGVAPVQKEVLLREALALLRQPQAAAPVK